MQFKLLLYRFFSTKLGKSILNFLSNGVTVNLNSVKKKRKFPFLVVVTVDTESGYVENNERRVWQIENPNAFQGYYYGLGNILEIFDKYKIKATFFLSTQCFSGKNKEFKIKKMLSNVIKKGHEIGLHLHPDSDFAIQTKLSKKFETTSAFFYKYNDIMEIIQASKDIIEDHLGKIAAKKLISFRWGNWALNSDGAKALNDTGFKVDSSATPGIKGHHNNGMKYDWSKVQTHYPWKLNIENYQDTSKKNSNVTEIPIATFNFFGLTLRADPVNSALLNRAFLKYYKKTSRARKPFPFVVVTHSSEATYYDGKPTQALKDLEEFIKLAKKYKDVKFVTMKEAYEMSKN